MKVKELLAEYNACRAFDGQEFVTLEDIVHVSKVQTVLSLHQISNMKTREEKLFLNLYLTWMWK